MRNIFIISLAILLNLNAFSQDETLLLPDLIIEATNAPAVVEPNSIVTFNIRVGNADWATADIDWEHNAFDMVGIRTSFANGLTIISPLPGEELDRWIITANGQNGLIFRRPAVGEDRLPMHPGDWYPEIEIQVRVDTDVDCSTNIINTFEVIFLSDELSQDNNTSTIGIGINCPEPPDPENPDCPGGPNCPEPPDPENPDCPGGPNCPEPPDPENPDCPGGPNCPEPPDPENPDCPDGDCPPVEPENPDCPDGDCPPVEPENPDCPDGDCPPVEPENPDCPDGDCPPVEPENPDCPDGDCPPVEPENPDCPDGDCPPVEPENPDCPDGDCPPVEPENPIIEDVDIILEKETSTNEAIINEIFEYILTVSNAGPNTALNIVVIDVLPKNMVYVSHSITEGIANWSSDINTFKWEINSLDNGQSRQATLKVKVTQSGNIINTASATTDSNDTDLTNNAAEAGKSILGIKIPNVFTPNGDSLNDTWEIQGVDNLKVDVTISNRWGAKVYKNSNYQNDWDGSGLSEGTYFYTIKITLPDGTPFAKNGYVAILKSSPQ